MLQRPNQLLPWCTPAGVCCDDVTAQWSGKVLDLWKTCADYGIGKENQFEVVPRLRHKARSAQPPWQVGPPSR